MRSWVSAVGVSSFCGAHGRTFSGVMRQAGWFVTGRRAWYCLKKFLLSISCWYLRNSLKSFICTLDWRTWMMVSCKNGRSLRNTSASRRWTNSDKTQCSSLETSSCIFAWRGVQSTAIPSIIGSWLFPTSDGSDCITLYVAENPWLSLPIHPRAQGLTVSGIWANTWYFDFPSEKWCFRIFRRAVSALLTWLFISSSEITSSGAPFSSEQMSRVCNAWFDENAMLSMLEVSQRARKRTAQPGLWLLPFDHAFSCAISLSTNFPPGSKKLPLPSCRLFGNPELLICAKYPMYFNSFELVRLAWR